MFSGVALLLFLLSFPGCFSCIPCCVRFQSQVSFVSISQAVSSFVSHCPLLSFPGFLLADSQAFSSFICRLPPLSFPHCLLLSFPGCLLSDSQALSSCIFRLPPLSVLLCLLLPPPGCLRSRSYSAFFSQSPGCLLSDPKCRHLFHFQAPSSLTPKCSSSAIPPSLPNCLLLSIRDDCALIPAVPSSVIPGFVLADP